MRDSRFGQLGSNSYSIRGGAESAQSSTGVPYNSHVSQLLCKFDEILANLKTSSPFSELISTTNNLSQSINYFKGQIDAIVDYTISSIEQQGLQAALLPDSPLIRLIVFTIEVLVRFENKDESKR
ncbi:hypothetical protein D6810_02200 [Candidatus Dojkabacteria bacterium]|uniref:Uncharacterized protein n=1 Tax=Candidatus Dojkabacteria bacterium TaxID=2099670 RepID=A0A3M0YYA4_9BACT|nr:MAG: hypothetical protein D6810_02200 [Candidatus Dojkabacteria bacterium]